MENIPYYIEESYHFTGIITFHNFELTAKNRLYRELPMGKSDYENFITNNEYELLHLVDGQQRITSILILLFEISKILPGNNILDKYFKTTLGDFNFYFFGYEVDVPSHTYLIREIFEDAAYPLPDRTFETLYTAKLTKAKHFFHNKLLELSDEQIERLLYKIENRLLFSTFNISSTNHPLDVAMIFETMNFRGKSLSASELFKNRLLYLINPLCIMIQSKRKLSI